MHRLPSLLTVAAITLFPLLQCGRAGDPNADWQKITALDAGPQVSPATEQEARAAAIAHAAAQERALRGFLKANPGDSHVFEAQLRLSRLLQIRAGMENSEAFRLEGKRILDELSKSAIGQQRVEVEFALITYRMRAMRKGSASDRQQLLAAAQRFQVDYPSDRRVPRLMIEVAHHFDSEPETKRSLLGSALSLTEDPELRARAADDLKRLDWLGKPIDITLTTASGKEVKLAEFHGKVVVLVYFADFSPPSMDAVTQLQRVARELPPESVQFAGICLDNKAEELAATISRMSLAWPVGFDGKGWAGANVRPFGINTLPTVWLIDQSGALRSLAGLESTKDQVLQMLRHPPVP